MKTPLVPAMNAGCGMQDAGFGGYRVSNEFNQNPIPTANSSIAKGVVPVVDLGSLSFKP